MNRKHIGGFNDWSEDDDYSLLSSRFQHAVREHAGKAGQRPRRARQDTDWSDRRPAGPRPQPYRDRGF